MNREDRILGVFVKVGFVQRYHLRRFYLNSLVVEYLLIDFLLTFEVNMPSAQLVIIFLIPVLFIKPSHPYALPSSFNASIHLLV